MKSFSFNMYKIAGVNISNCKGSTCHFLSSEKFSLRFSHFFFSVSCLVHLPHFVNIALIFLLLSLLLFLLLIFLIVFLLILFLLLLLLIIIITLHLPPPLLLLRRRLCLLLLLLLLLLFLLLIALASWVSF